MKIVKNDLKIVCDIKGCNRLADYKLLMDVLKSDAIMLCSRCLREFYELAGENIKSEDDLNAEKRKNKRK